MNNPVRWGILGAANFAREQMGPAIHAAKGAELFALATSDATKAAGFTAFAPGLRVHDTYDTLLADPDIDAVYIPLPNHLHVEWTLKALAAGKPVLTEKPITMQSGEFDQLIAARDNSGLLAAEAFMIVHHPQWIHARDLVADGAIGRLVRVDTTFSFDNRSETQNIRNRADTGGGSLRDIGVYTIGSARFVTGAEMSDVRASIDRENGVEVTCEMHARLGEVRFTGYTSMRAHPRQEVNFHGEKGVIRMTTPFNANVFGMAQVVLERDGFEVMTRRYPGVNQYVIQVENFGASLRDGADYPCPLEFSRGTQDAIDAAMAAG